MKLNTVEIYPVQPNFASYLTDESGLVHGNAEKIFFPQLEEDIIKIVKHCNEKGINLTISGGGTGLTGGRAPLDGWIIATDKATKLISHLEGKKTWKDKDTGKSYEYHLKIMDKSNAQLTVPVALTIRSLQKLTKSLGWFYPPDPTERQAFIGGSVTTNASGARSFKFGPTRNWVEKLRIILPNGSLTIQDRRLQDFISNKTSFSIKTSNDELIVPRPTYSIPNVRKNVVGPIITNSSQPIDLFIGTDGIFGIITEITLRLIRPPTQIISMILFCPSIVQALDIVTLAQKNRSQNIKPIPLSVELVDRNAVELLKQQKQKIPSSTHTICYLEQDIYSEQESYETLEFWASLFEDLGIEETWIEDSPAGIEKHKNFRHSLPESVNSIVKRNSQAKLGTDYSVPLTATKMLYTLCEVTGIKFDNFCRTKKNLPRKYPTRTLWAHAGDNHVHMNFLPKTIEESNFAKKLMIEMMRKIVALGGSIGAEHGLGKKKFNQKLAIFYQYSEKEVEQIRQFKKILDPNAILNYGTLI